MEMEFKDNSRRRRLLIVLGVVLAVVAGGAAFYLSSGQQQAPSTADLPTRTVIIAATDIPAHTVIESSHLTQRTLPDDPSIAQAVTDPQQVIGRVTGVGVYANQPIMPNLIATSAVGAKFSILAPNEVITDTSPHWRAVSINVPDERAVGGQLVANQRVDVVITAQVNVLNPDSASGDGPVSRPVAGGQLPVNGQSGASADCRLRPYTQNSGKGATQTNCAESDIFYTDKSSKVTYQDVLVLSKNETQYVLKVDERTAEEISHLQAAGNSSFSMILRPDGDARHVDTSGYGETTNSIIERYGLPVPEAYPRP